MPIKVLKILDKVEQKTKNNCKVVFSLCLAYSGREEIIHGVNSMSLQTLSKGYHEDITVDDFKKYLYTKDEPDPDIIFRSGGELRKSGFLLWQGAYSELSFSKLYWPAFHKYDFYSLLIHFNKRNRRFGA